MFGSTRTAATIAVIALSSSLALMAGPLRSTPAPAGAPAEPSPSPVVEASDGVYFTGAMRFVNNELGGNWGTTETGADGIERNRGAGSDVVWDTSDPRFTGGGEYTSNHNDYLTESGMVVRVGWGTQRLDNEEGAWRSVGSGAGVVIDPAGTIDEQDAAITGWFDGEGAYEGMSALVLYTIEQSAYGAPVWNLQGWIVPGDAHLEEVPI
jgi:hypothetical protein